MKNYRDQVFENTFAVARISIIEEASHNLVNFAYSDLEMKVTLGNPYRVILWEYIWDQMYGI